MWSVPRAAARSTLLRTIAGLEDSDGGTIEIDGVRINDVRPRDRNIAMVFQNYALYPYMTVLENIAFGLRARRTPEAEIARRGQQRRRAARHRPACSIAIPRHLSGGQRQRVAIGRAIVRKPGCSCSTSR